MTLVWIMVMIMVPFGLASQFYHWVRAKKRQEDLDLAARKFIRLNGLEGCKPGFYEGKEKLLAKQLGIDVNAAYQLISLNLGK